jgi:ubiquinone/menaquinone biosynthesis C-methylase UbiE
MHAICLKCKRILPIRTPQENGRYSCECGKFVETHQQFSTFEKVLYLLRFVSIDGNEERFWQKSQRYIKRHTYRRKLDILNIGAGGGHGFLNKLGSVTAIDLSFSSLLNAQRIYDTCYQADARQIPFPDGSFDIVFSAHLLGHIPLDHKQDVIKEIYRVTKVGGFSLHSIECEADNFIYREAKKHKTLYQKYFQDMYGHYGLEFPSLCKQRFRTEPFEPVYELSDYCKGIIRPANSYKVFFGAKEYREKDWRFNALATISEILSVTRYVSFLTGFFLYPLTLLNRFGGPDAVDSVKLLYRKKG